MGRRKFRGIPTQAPGDLQKPTKTSYCRPFSVCRPDESSVPPRALEQPVRRRRELPRSRPRAVRIGPGRRPGPSRTAPERSKRSRERPDAGQDALRPPQSRPSAKTGPRAPQRLQGRSRRRRKGLPGSVSTSTRAFSTMSLVLIDRFREPSEILRDRGASPT